jgi:hypothetical protein
MARGFIYVVTSVTKDYEQQSFCNVPTEFAGRLYFGPCKRAMRPKMQPGDLIFGLSPSHAGPRRILFATRIEEQVSFQQAYLRFPELRGPKGPIHVRPVERNGPFPLCRYEHIEKSMHRTDWMNDLRSDSLDAFFVCQEQDGWMGRWLGRHGPELDCEILTQLQACEVHGRVNRLSVDNKSSTLSHPIAHGCLFVGLHLETAHPDILLRLCRSRLRNMPNVGPHLGAGKTNSGSTSCARRCAEGIKP